MAFFQDRASVIEETKFIVGIVSIGHFVSHIYLVAFPPLFPLIGRDLGLSNAQLGLLVSIIFIIMFILQTPVGYIVDIIGAKRVFVLGLVVSASGILMAGFATSYVMLLLSAFICGVGQSAFHPADFPLLDVVSDETNQGKHFALHQFGGFLGFSAAPIIVGGIGIAFRWELGLIVAGLIGLFFAVFAQIALSPIYLNHINAVEQTSKQVQTSLREKLSSFKYLFRPSIFGTFVFFGFSTIASIGLNSFIVVYAIEGFEFSNVVGNTSLSAFLILATAGVLGGGVLADRYDVRIVILITLLITSGMTILTIVGRPWITPLSLIGLFCVLGLFYGLCVPARDSLVSLVSPPDAVGKSFGFAYTGLSLGGFISPILLGVVIDEVNVFAAFLIIAVSFTIAALMVVPIKFMSEGVTTKH